MGRPKMRIGNRPSDPKWKLISELEGNGVFWEVFWFGGEGSSWANFKIISKSRIKGGANYGLGFNLEERRFARGKALEAFQSRRPELFAQLEKVIDDQFPAPV